jgi:hypothetical protein
VRKVGEKKGGRKCEAMECADQLKKAAFALLQARRATLRVSQHCKNSVRAF